MTDDTELDKPDSIAVSITSLPLKEEDPWPKPQDTLRRSIEIEALTPIILNARAPIVFGLDAPWGAGKTTFVKLWEMYLKREGYKSLYINAWENDFAEDPLVPILSSLDSWLSQEEPPTVIASSWDKAKAIAPAFTKTAAKVVVKAATLGSVDIEEDITPVVQVFADGAGELAGNMVDQFANQRTSIDKFKQLMGDALDVLPTNQNNLIVFIDELDRCRPLFAIELLERVKHIFDLDRIAFVLSTNRKQLGFALQGVYGGNFDGYAYLRRFIDIEYKLRKPSIKAYINSLFNFGPVKESLDATGRTSANLSTVVEVVGLAAEKWDFSLRELNQMATRLSLAIRSSPKEGNFGPIVLSTLIVLQEKDPALYQDLRRSLRKLDDALLSVFGYNSSSTSYPEHFPAIAGWLIAATFDGYRGGAHKVCVEPWAERAKNLDQSLSPALARQLSETVGIAQQGFTVGGSSSIHDAMDKIDLVTTLKL